MGRLRLTLALGAALAALGAGSELVVSSAAAATAEGAPAPGEAGQAPAPAVTAPGGPTPSTADSPAVEPLSNETTLTSWAHPEAREWIRARPQPNGRRVARISLLTPDGFPEVYVLLASYVDGDGRTWIEVRIPGRPNGRTGWLPREDLGAFHQTRWRIVVNREERHMTVYYAGRVLRVFPVGVGKPSTPTPAGHFWIDERFKLSNPSNPYWPYALGTSDYSTLPDWPGEGVVGIHGPYGEPQKIPGDPSHGCIRMLAPDIAWLGPRVTLGTPVDVI